MSRGGQIVEEEPWRRNHGGGIHLRFSPLVWVRCWVHIMLVRSYVCLSLRSTFPVFVCFFVRSFDCLCVSCFSCWWGVTGDTWAHLGDPLGTLGHSLGALGHALDTLWALLGTAWTPLVPLWALFGDIGHCRGDILVTRGIHSAPFGHTLEHTSTILETCLQKGQKIIIFDHFLDLFPGRVHMQSVHACAVQTHI